MENKNQSHSYTFVPKNKIKEEKDKEEKLQTLASDNCKLGYVIRFGCV